MKKTLLLFCCGLFAMTSQAQVQTPQASPHAKTTQMVGLTEVSLDYSRPGMKEREVFGNLVPYGKIWRTGANENSTITFSDDVKINGKTLEKGTYAIFTKPNEGAWEVYFYEDTENWGAPKALDKEKIALLTEAEVSELPFNMETFSILIGNITNHSADLNFVWEQTVATVEIAVPTKEKVAKSIDATMQGDPSMEDYYSAASYYLREGIQMEKAGEWVEKAVEMHENPPFYMLYVQSLIQARLGEKEAAIKTAKLSLEKAKAAGSDHYIKLNEASLKEWGAN